MTFIDMGDGFEDVKESTIAPEARYDLHIEDAEHRNSDGKSDVAVRIIIDNPPADIGDEVSAIFHYVSIPKPDDTADKRRFKQLFSKRFCVLFNIPMDGNSFNVEDFNGSRAKNVMVKVDRSQSTPSNKIDLPSLPDEVPTGNEGGRGGRKKR